MRNVRLMTNPVVACLVAAIIFTLTACAMPVLVPIPSGAQQKSADVAAYSKESKSQADVDIDVKICREWATKSTNFDPNPAVDPNIVKKWPDTWLEWFEKSWEWVQEHLGKETEQGRWNRYYSTCMDARKYSVK